jgi:hypothetical protein
MTAAFDLVGAPGDADRIALARDLVADRFTIEAMAGTLASVYAGITAPMTLPVAEVRAS